MPGSVSDGNGSLQVIDSITQFINGTQAVWNSITVPIPAGLAVYATDTTVVKIGDGVTLYANLPSLFTVSSISNLTSELATISTTNASYATQLAALQADITALQADITGISGGSLSTQVASLTTEYNSLLAQFGSLNTEVNAIQSAAGGYATAAEITTLTSDYNTLNTEVNTLNTEVAGLTTTLTPIPAEITSLQSAVAASVAISQTLGNSSQRYVDVSSTRTSGTAYTNSTSAPILAILQCQSNGSSSAGNGTITVGGVIVYGFGTNTSQNGDYIGTSMTVVVPPGVVYSYNYGSFGATIRCFELR